MKPDRNVRWAILAALLGLVVSTAAGQTSQSSNTIPDTGVNTRKQRQLPESSPYAKWLNEEVVYIITSEERDAFYKLATDDEREMFVKQFWERRNPDPGSQENKYKEEHYRGIAYANARFATNRPGWQTDRGLIYIMLGPPDEINPRHGSMGVDEQDWKYRYIDGIGENVIFTFIDYVGDGEYRVWPRSQSDAPRFIRR